MNFHRHKLKLVESAPFTRTRLICEQPDVEQPEVAPENPEEAPAMDAAPPQDDPQAQPGVEPADTPEAKAEEPDDKALAIAVRTTEGVADDFRVAVKNALVTLPPEIRKIISDHGFAIMICKSMGELETELDGPSHVPLTRLASVFLRNSKEIAIAESIKDENEADLPTLNPAGVIRHVFGHAVDELAPEYLKGTAKPKFSDLESFKYAHVSDIGRLAEDKKKKLAFYVEDEDASRSECFAECFAALHEGGSTYSIEVMSQFFPAVMKQVKDTLEAIKTDTKMTDTDGDGIPDETQQKDEPAPTAKEEPAKTPVKAQAPAKPQEPAPEREAPEAAPEPETDEDPEDDDLYDQLRTPEEAELADAESKAQGAPDEGEDEDEDLLDQLLTPEEAAAKEKKVTK